MADLEWYGVKTLYRHQSVEKKDGRKLYEERVVLFRAVDFEDAIAQAEAEAKKYCEGTETVFLEFVNAYLIGEDAIWDRSEVYSIMRDSELDEDDYINRFYDTGSEHSGTIEPEA